MITDFLYLLPAFIFPFYDSTWFNYTNFKFRAWHRDLNLNDNKILEMILECTFHVSTFLLLLLNSLDWDERETGFNNPYL